MFERSQGAADEVFYEWSIGRGSDIDIRGSPVRIPPRSKKFHCLVWSTCSFLRVMFGRKVLDSLHYLNLHYRVSYHISVIYCTLYSAPKFSRLASPALFSYVFAIFCFKFRELKVVKTKKIKPIKSDENTPV